MKIKHILENSNETQSELLLLVKELSGKKPIKDIEIDYNDGVRIETTKGDIILIRYNKQYFAIVQGQKDDIYCGEIGNTSVDVLDFVKDLVKEGSKWYKEYDPNW